MPSNRGHSDSTDSSCHEASETHRAETIFAADEGEDDLGHGDMRDECSAEGADGWHDECQQLAVSTTPEKGMFKPNPINGRQGLLVCDRLLRPFVSGFGNDALPPSSPIGNRDHHITHLFGAYEEVFSTRIHYLRQGLGSNNILLFPGPFGCVRTDYMDFLQRLNRNEFTAIAFDPPGCGFSTPPVRDWSDPEVLLQDARVGVNLMRQLGHLPFSCIGWSEGALSAIRAASELNMDGSIEGLVVWELEEDIGAEDGSGNGGQIMGGTPGSVDFLPDSRRLPLQAVYGRAYMRDSWPAYVETKEMRRMGPADLRCLPQRLLGMPLLHIASRHSESRRHQNANSQSTESALLACSGCCSTLWPARSDANQKAGWQLPHKLHADFFQSCVENFILKSIH
nr:unnamed protein product [Spirometra erinaceieuropaei]